MKLLRVRANHFKNCADNFEIDFAARSRKTAEDKEYELFEAAPGLYTYNTLAFVGKNASGKTTAVELLDACCSILGKFRLETGNFNFENAGLTMEFYHDGYIYRYATCIKNEMPIGGKCIFYHQKTERKKYYKSKVKDIYSDDGFSEVKMAGELPEDTSDLFFVLKKSKTRAIYYDSFGCGPDTYALVFAVMKTMDIPQSVLEKIIYIFDENISGLRKIDEHNYRISICGSESVVSDRELIYRLSSGTTKGMLVYILAAASLQNGFDLIIDEIENHFHKTLAENLLSLYKDKRVNKHGATLIFTTHYCELLDLFNRQDNIYICRADKKVYLTNMYRGYNIRPELLKSRQFYNNVFDTAVNYEALMKLKKELSS